MANVKGKKVIRRRREKKNIEKGQVHIILELTLIQMYQDRKE